MNTLNKIPAKSFDNQIHLASSRKTVLVVDDDDISMFLSCKILQKTGMVNGIHTVINGKHAINLLNDYYRANHSLPDFILLDINTPVMNGFQFLMAFKVLTIPDKEKVKVIMVSSSEDICDTLKAKELGANNYITKPLQAEKLRIELIVA